MGHLGNNFGVSGSIFKLYLIFLRDLRLAGKPRHLGKCSDQGIYALQRGGAAHGHGHAGPQAGGSPSQHLLWPSPGAQGREPGEPHAGSQNFTGVTSVTSAHRHPPSQVPRPCPTSEGSREAQTPQGGPEEGLSPGAFMEGFSFGQVPCPWKHLFFAPE